MELTDEAIAKVMLHMINQESDLGRVQQLCQAMEEAVEPVMKSGPGFCNGDLSVAAATMIAALVLDIPQMARVQGGEALKLLVAQMVDRAVMVQDTEIEAFGEGKWPVKEAAD